MNCSPRIKICCIGSVEEARLAIRYGADALGLVSHMPSGPGVISNDLIAQIAGIVPPGVASFLLTSLQDTASIIDQHRRCRTNTLQLVDRLEEGCYEDLRKVLPGIAIVQVIHVRGEESVAEAVAVAAHVDALLLDSGNQALKIKELGGTGRTHNWDLSRRICVEAGLPIYLAGGLNQHNVKSAIREVNPFGLDLCSGVRTNGKLDEDKLAAYIEEIRSCMSGIRHPATLSNPET